VEENRESTATPLATAMTVLSAFFGIRRRGDHERQTVRLAPVQIVVAGVIGATLFVGGLIVLVRFILRAAAG
jgi:hypothetical protein